MTNQIITLNYNSKNVGKEFVKSLHSTGFVILNNHKLDNDLIEKVYHEWDKFFDNDEKYSYTFNPDTQDGYFPYKSENAKGYPHKDLKEFYHYYEWGKYPDKMSKNTSKMFLSMMKLGKILLDWIDSYSPVEVKSNYSMPLSQMIEGSSMNLLRIIHYPPLYNKPLDESIRASAHEDINLITLLLPGSEPGLQVLNNDNQWINIKCDPDWLVINTGDMLNECSNGYFPSTTHRVINPKESMKNISRFTMPLFIHPRDEIVLSNKYTARSFLDERLKQIGLKY